MPAKHRRWVKRALRLLQCYFTPTTRYMLAYQTGPEGSVELWLLVKATGDPYAAHEAFADFLSLWVEQHYVVRDTVQVGLDIE